MAPPLALPHLQLVKEIKPQLICMRGQARSPQRRPPRQVTQHSQGIPWQVSYSHACSLNTGEEELSAGGSQSTHAWLLLLICTPELSSQLHQQSKQSLGVSENGGSGKEREIPACPWGLSADGQLPGWTTAGSCSCNQAATGEIKANEGAGAKGMGQVACIVKQRTLCGLQPFKYRQLPPAPGNKTMKSCLKGTAR